MSTSSLLLLQPVTAPGRGTGTDTGGAASGSTTTATTGASGVPSEGPPPPGAPSMVMMALMFVLPIAFILWMNRSQSKKQQSLEQSLAVGDRVVTQAGLFGKLTELGEKRAKLEIAPGVTVQVLKGSIASKDAT